MQIFIQIFFCDKNIIKTIELNVESTDTIAIIKKQIYEKEGILIEQQKLYLNGKLLEDQNNISFYNIQKEYELILIRHIPINIKTMSGKIITLDVKPSDIIKNIKEIIYEKEGIPIRLQKLYLESLDGIQLDDWNSISFYDIEKESDILLINLIEIIVRTISGKRIIFDVKPSDTIRNIKEQIYDKEGIPIKEQKLF